MRRLSLTLLILQAVPAAAQVDPWELPPVLYSETPATDALSSLAASWQRDPSQNSGNTPLDRVRCILAALKVPQESQVLVFSKTSEQNHLINPATPRALFFSPDVYCGYVPGGMMEVAIQDPALGPVFYLIRLGEPGAAPIVERDTSECLTCHATARTESVPGVMIRSVFPDPDGLPILSQGSGVITHETPIPQRWGGYYVTGSISLPHLGNRSYPNPRESEPALSSLQDVSGKLDTTRYPRPTSDIVALMVLEHQCHAHNLLTAATFNYKRARHLSLSLDPSADPDSGSAGRIADHAAREIVDCFLFRGEAEQGPDGVEGDPSFQSSFLSQIPKSREGRSLADFELNRRLFKHRCSYMVYSLAFQHLPPAVKSRVIARLHRVFEATTLENDPYPDLKLPERQRTARILRETGIF